MKNILFILFLGLSTGSFGQIIGTHYFNDTLNGKLNHIYDHIEVEDGVIISGSMNIGANDHPVIIKISPDGNLVWSTINTTRIGTTNYMVRFNIELFDDGYIYGTSHSSNSSNRNRIWKVNAQTGAVEYARTFHSNDIIDIKLEEYDGTRFIATYSKNEAGINYSIFASLKKNDGDSLFTRNMGVNNSMYQGTRVDADKNIYLWSGNKFMKFNKGNLNEKLWERTYQTGVTNALDIIQDVHLDQEDRIFLFGNDGGTWGYGDGNVLEVSALDGSKLWDTQGVPGEIEIRDIIDRDGKLYMCYQHGLVGASFTRYFACRIDKATGVRDWYCFHSMSTVGIPASYSGNMQSGLSIDLDCSGGLYMTGYYGDANYGPANWGVMKVDANTGTKLYDFTITGDSTYYDRYSCGKAVCVFGDSPIVLGNYENLSSPNFWKGDGYYVAFDPQNGTILDRRGIAGQFQLQSKTINMIRQDQTMYVYKQHGKYLAVEAMDADQNVIWSRTVSDTSLLKGGQLAVTPNYIYITAHMNYSTGGYPFDNGVAFRYYVYRINRSTGVITHSTYMPILIGTIAPMEIEAEDDQFFFYYRRNSGEYVRKWTVAGGYGIEYAVNLAGNSLLFDGEHNNVLNYNTTSLITIGADAIRLVPKATINAPTVLFNFAGTRTYFDHEFYQDKLYMAGTNNSGQKLVTVYDIAGDSIVWENTYGLGSFFRIDRDPYNNFVLGGERDSIASAAMIKRIDGSLIWETYIDSIAHPVTHLVDCHVNKLANIITLTGARHNTNGSSDVILTNMNYYGDTLFTYMGEDVQNLRSTGFTIEEGPDSTTWFGGAHNRLITVKEGFIYRMGTSYCERFVAGDSVSCPNDTPTLTAWPGASYQWYLDGVAIPGETGQSITPLSSGSYNVLVADACSIDSMISAFEHVIADLPIVDLSAGGSFCFGDSLQLQTTTPGTYQWYYDGTLLSGSTANTIYATDPGTYNVLVTNFSGCADSSANGSTVSVFPQTTVSFALTDDTVCENDPAVNLTGTPNGGIFSGTGVTSTQFDPSTVAAGTYYISYEYTDVNSCSTTQTDTMTVLGATSSVLNIAAVDSYTLNGQTYTSSGTYQQTVTNAAGCDSVITLNLDLDFTGLNELNTAFKVRPNPGNGNYVLTSVAVLSEELVITDAEGRIVERIVPSGVETKIDLTTQQNGVYFLHAQGVTIRIVKL